MSTGDWATVEARHVQLEQLGPEDAAKHIAKALAEVDPRLSVEVLDHGGERQVIVSAGRDREAFAKVRSLVAAAPSWPRWRFIALRPARGLEFELQAGRRIDPRALSFAPRMSDDGLIIRLMVPNPEFEGWADVAWELVETAIGEELAARIASLEIDKRGAEDDGVYALEMLSRYVDRHTDAG